jgi:hypothetical protein
MGDSLGIFFSDGESLRDGAEYPVSENHHPE